MDKISLIKNVTDILCCEEETLKYLQFNKVLNAYFKAIENELNAIREDMKNGLH